MLPDKWLRAVGKIDYAFQPITNSLTGVTFAVEALIRNVEQAGFESIEDFFDQAYQDKVLFALDLELRKIAFYKFSQIEFCQKIKLYYNYDARMLEMPDHRFGATEEIIDFLHLTHETICFELNERYRVEQNEAFRNLLSVFKERGFKLALDDFGAGFSSFELFYHADPDVLKFDRFLIQNIDKDLRKKTFCANIVNMAKLLGVLVIAEGIETPEELATCQKIGFDLIQGYLIQKPVCNIDELSYIHPQIIQSEIDSVSLSSRDVELISREIIKLDTIYVNDDIRILFEKFHKNLQFDFFPVIDKTGIPLGIIHEKNIKKYVYSPYGKDLLCNKSVTTSLVRFISKCPIIDIHTPQEKILEIYLNNPDSEGVIITKGQGYFGFLTAKSLLNIINEKNLALAREINPLTKLPGNILINQYISDLLVSRGNCYYLVYFDFNHFKPFNDKWGFSKGDQVIKIFADILKNVYHSGGAFIGHIGGDDFFIGLKCEKPCLEEELQRVRKVVSQFAYTVRIFHSEDELAKGFFVAKDRYGKTRKFPLMSASAAILEIFGGARSFSAEEVSRMLSQLKKAAKESSENIASASLGIASEVF
ncbi:MAG TPA: GGDEF domain-containing protein [Firmicutes bacterium]|jgi:diguanylate cyclase (GGDEF)-like protein|nr:GGDEF domain-containing protein [Bacillota bacterium]